MGASIEELLEKIIVNWKKEEIGRQEEMEEMKKITQLVLYQHKTDIYNN